jgi:hypothetical protein
VHPTRKHCWGAQSPHFHPATTNMLSDRACSRTSAADIAPLTRTPFRPAVCRSNRNFTISDWPHGVDPGGTALPPILSTGVRGSVSEDLPGPEQPRPRFGTGVSVPHSESRSQGLSHALTLICSVSSSCDPGS